MLQPSEEKDLFKNIVGHSNKLYVYDRHFYQFDWSNLPNTQVNKNLSKNRFTYMPWFQVNMINMVREPVDRIISQFYYLRSLKRWKSKERPPKQWFQKEFQKCVLNGDKECQVLNIFDAREILSKKQIV